MAEIDFVKLRDELIRDEGNKHKPYTDTVGKITIGIGHNLTDKGLSSEIINMLYVADISEVLEDLDNNFDWWRKMSAVRQHVLANMCFNMGMPVLLTFKNTLEAMSQGKYDRAANGMQHSTWFKQVGIRAVRLIEQMRVG